MKTVSDVKLAYLVRRLLERIAGSESKLLSQLSGSEEALRKALQDHLADDQNPHSVQFSQLGGNVGKSLADAVYPVGALYISTSPTSPAALFGGSWAPLEGRFLLGAGSAYAPGSRGGSDSHTLTEAELPEHSHLFHVGSHGSAQDVPFDVPRTALEFAYQNQYASGSLDTTIVGPTGENQSFSTMPPYIAVYMWERTA